MNCRPLTALIALLLLLTGGRPLALADEQVQPPAADQARNLEVDPDAEPSLLRRAGQIALLPVRGALWLAFYPVRKGLFALDRYQVIDRLGRLLSGDSAITLFPSLKLEAGFGVTYGIGLGYKDYVRGEFLFGGEARQIYGIKARTRDLLGKRLQVDLEVELQLLKDSRFNGIGNRESSEVAAGPLIDPTTDGTSIATLFDQDIFRIELGAWYRPTRSFGLRVSGAYLQRSFDQASEEDGLELSETYDPMALVGYEGGLEQIYPELRAEFDNRDQPFPLRTQAIPVTGWKLTGWVGAAVGQRDDPTQHVRLGFDAQRFVHLHGGDRVLIARLRGEAVTSDRQTTAFVDLPSLGGSRILRGYRRGRFRDRIASVGSLEYRFPINALLTGFAFADAGRVYEGADKLTLRGLHWGGGGGLIVHSADRFLVRVQVGGGDDGIVFNASLSPSARVKRATRRR